MTLRRACVVSLAALTFYAGCGRGQPSTDDDAALAQTVAALRDAPNSDKRPWLQRLEASKCTSPAACRLRDICSKAYRTHERALESARAAKHAMQRDAGTTAIATGTEVSGATAVEQSARLLMQAEEALREARTATQECASLELQWRRKGT